MSNSGHPAVVVAISVLLCVLTAVAAPAAKTLPDLKPNHQTWDSYLGCLQGCLKYLKSDVSPAWLYGVSGHAFGLNIHKQLCPSGPHVWSGWGSLQGNEALLGLKIERLGPWFKGHDTRYIEHRREVWEAAQAALDADKPVIGYDLNWAEFYVVNGYDENSYLYWNTNMGALKPEKLAWGVYGDRGTLHMLALQVVSATKPAGTPRQAVKTALQWAVRFGARGDVDDPMRSPDYASGLAAYDQWLQALDDPECWKGDCMGAMYNAEVWRECRRQAVAFLQEAKTKVGAPKLAPQFEEAIRHYQRVEQKLGIVCEQFSFDSPAAKKPQAERRERAQRNLREAQRAEEKGLAVLADIVQGL